MKKSVNSALPHYGKDYLTHTKNETQTRRLNCVAVMYALNGDILKIMFLSSVDVCLFSKISECWLF